MHAPVFYLLASASLLSILLAASSGSPTRPADCAAFRARVSPFLTYLGILSCLNNDDRRVALDGPVFNILRGIDMPPNSRLEGILQSNGAVPRLRIAGPTAMSSFVLRIHDDTVVKSLVLDASRNLKGLELDCCTSVVGMVGNGSTVEDAEITGADVGTGIYFHNAQAAAYDNAVHRVHVHDCFYGVVFETGLNGQSGNKVTSSLIEHVSCDGVTFAGYGEIRKTTIRNCGFQCGRYVDTQAGGGIYCAGNSDGALIHENEVYSNCGRGLDVDTCAKLDVVRNTFRTSFSPTPGVEKRCSDFATVSFLDTRDSYVEENIIVHDADQSKVPEKDDDNFFSDITFNTPPFKDLPGVRKTIAAFALLRRPRSGAQPAVGNVIRNNKAFAKCTNNTTCVGVGVFAGRGTGRDETAEPFLRYSWQPNNFTGNVVKESDVGSRRCGRNWYAGGASDCGENDLDPCNDDDHETAHRKNPFRNDDCDTYTAFIGKPLQRLKRGRLRVLLPLPLPPTLPPHSTSSLSILENVTISSQAS